MEQKRKFIIISLLGLVILALLILSSSLSVLNFQPGIPFSLETVEPQQEQAINSRAVAPLVSTVVRAALAVALVTTFIYIIYAIINPKERKRLLFAIATMAVIYLLMSWISRSVEGVIIPMQPASSLEDMFGQETTPGPVASFDPNPPEWIVAVVTVTFAALIGFVIFLIARILWQPKRRLDHGLSKLADQAEASLIDLQYSSDLRSAIIRCYQEMSRVLGEERGIYRSGAMTPREFEDILFKKGLPEQPVRNLTRLFEMARYSPTSPGKREELQAVDSLSAISAACRRER